MMRELIIKNGAGTATVEEIRFSDDATNNYTKEEIIFN